MIDDHVHPFALDPTDFDPADLTLDLAASPADRAADRPHRLTAELVVQRLGGLLGCPPEETPAARAEAAVDWPGWTRRLLDAADVEGVVMDPAWAGAGPPVSAYAELAGRPVWELQRLEPTVDAQIGNGAGVGDIIDAVDELMTTAAGRGCVGFKTVLAYRTGLAVDPTVSVADAEQSLRSDAPVRRRGKALRDLVLTRALARCVDLGLPIQVHTGFGDSDISPRDADPLLLDELLRTPPGRSAQIVLIHGSWPWHDALGYLASVHHNVWAELSEVQLFAPALTADRMLRLLEVAPTNRVLLGSDGHGTAESIWYGCLLLHEAWAAVRSALADAGARDGWLDGVRQRIFTGNAQVVYRLSS